MLPWQTDPENYATLFAKKCSDVEKDMLTLRLPPAERFASPVESYRVRAEFRIWHDGDDIDYVMFDPGHPRTPVVIKDFAPALAPIRTLMPQLLAFLKSRPVLRRKLFQAEFMATTTGELLLTLIYHRPLDDAWEDEARALAREFDVSLVGRSRKQKRIIGRDFVVDAFTVDGRCYRYRQYEQSFVQPNAPINEAMLTWAWQQGASCPGDLLELYCGNGNFTLPLASRFPAVIATELSKSGTRAALENIRDNGVDNVQVIRLSAEEVSEAMSGVREFRRLATLPKPLGDYDLRTVFVDPPRAGLDPGTLDCVRDFEAILYVSCNPKTLKSNIEALTDSHVVTHYALFDQFPYTPHIESAVVLRRRRLQRPVLVF
ncbi:tRNA (uridine(54)-C5)-methyltransferase TrmA [Congregibacter litoralis]|uniref:tRNA/tmRNA (uracil-C(5))-methyltransferase n=1 Tax=Congregibacter litoralis KT71 TaxID=314285 RepID=A4A8C7_9GAMM|nr:tRNA (uridine(54)-C5)-methyltransferase TrmA [Congregibacter litoralis]EAQ97922.1 tRNA (uracil-5-)-methyltransferase [Congregibacter litoralis KT71]